MQFLANRMGIVNCADEHMGSMEDDPKLELHLGRTWENSVYNIATKVLKDSATSGKTTQEVSITHGLIFFYHFVSSFLKRNVLIYNFVFRLRLLSLMSVHVFLTHFTVTAERRLSSPWLPRM
jgi:hypothetical protein